MGKRQKKQSKKETGFPIPFAAMSPAQSNTGMGIGAELDGAGLRDYLACQLLAEIDEEK